MSGRGPTFAGLAATLPQAQVDTIAWFLDRLASPASPPGRLPDDVLSGWRSLDMARFGIEQSLSIAGECTLEQADAALEGEVRCALRDRRQRPYELLLSFESAHSPRLTRACVRPVLPEDVVIRTPGPADAAEMQRLELAAPIRREDGSEVVIDHAGTQFDRQHLIRDHRWLAAFRAGRMVAVQGVAITSTLVGGTTCRIAYNHYSRSDPGTRNSGNLIHLVATLYRDIYPSIDQFVSIVDVQNPTGLRLSFGSPWPARARRLFLSTTALAARALAPPRHIPFDPELAATLLNTTHEGLNLWVPRTASFLMERRQRAPEVYGRDCWRMTQNAALAVWRSGESRTYRNGNDATVRKLALVLDYGFSGPQGRLELLALLCEAAVEAFDQGISHLALFVPDEHPRSDWLAELAEAIDTYAICAPILKRPAPPLGPVYVDHVIF